jgi:glycosyltransferase involved in cell wall biosynthesis
MRILHVTEAMGGGIVTVTDSFSRRQTEAGAQVTVMYTRRPDTPDPEEMRARFHPSVQLVELPGSGTRGAVMSLYRAVRGAQRSRRFDAIHLHSSYAGLAGRLADIGIRNSTPVFYSPHGFGFLRQDQSKLTIAGAKASERWLANRGGLILTSASEIDIANEQLHAKHVDFVRTGIPRDSIEAMTERTLGQPVTVAMVARVIYQKAPWRFAEVARRLAGKARFIWIGDGPDELKAEWFADAPIEVLGWLSPSELEDAMSKIDILLFPSLWEGFALSLAQAQASGIPAVVSDVVGNRDAVIDGTTGFVGSDDDELAESVERLIDDPELWHSMSRAATEWARRQLIDDDLGRESLEIYTRLR